MNIIKKPVPTREFTNISDYTLECVKAETVNAHVVVKQKTHGEFLIDKMASYQFLQGFRIKTIVQSTVQEMKLIQMLLGLQTEQFRETPLSLTREDVLILKNWLETRMSHCEKERDQRSQYFNADTYIIMKLMLLDLREWLIGEIVD